MDRLERDFQRHLISRLYKEFPGCVVLKTDPSYIQGFPDLLILYRDKWAALEVKKSTTAPHQPNQDDWVFNLYEMSYAAFISPETEEGVLDALRFSFGIAR